MQPMATNAMATTTSKAFLRSVAPQPPLADAPGDSARPMLSSPAATERSSVTATDAFGLSLRKEGQLSFLDRENSLYTVELFVSVPAMY